jgi:hypothetical protein
MFGEYSEMIKEEFRKRVVSRTPYFLGGDMLAYGILWQGPLQLLSFREQVRMLVCLQECPQPQIRSFFCRGCAQVGIPWGYGLAGLP